PRYGVSRSLNLRLKKKVVFDKLRKTVLKIKVDNGEKNRNTESSHLIPTVSQSKSSNTEGTSIQNIEKHGNSESRQRKEELLSCHNPRTKKYAARGEIPARVRHGHTF